MAWQRGRAYAQDFRDRVLTALGLLREVAERFKVSPSYVSRARTRSSRLGHHLHDAHLAPLAQRQALSGAHAFWSLAYHHVYLSIARSKSAGAVGAERANQWPCIYSLGGAELVAPRLVAGDIVLMDNLSSHMIAGVKAAIVGAGAALRYLPPYSLDF